MTYQPLPRIKRSVIQLTVELVTCWSHRNVQLGQTTGDRDGHSTGHTGHTRWFHRHCRQRFINTPVQGALNLTQGRRNRTTVSRGGTWVTRVGTVITPRGGHSSVYGDVPLNQIKVCLPPGQLFLYVLLVREIVGIIHVSKFLLSGVVFRAVTLTTPDFLFHRWLQPQPVNPHSRLRGRNSHRRRWPSTPPRRPHRPRRSTLACR